MVSFKDFSEVYALGNVVEQHKAWLEDYKGLFYSKAFNGQDLIKWAKERKYYNYFDSGINKIARKKDRLIIEFDNKNSKGEKDRESKRKTTASYTKKQFLELVKQTKGICPVCNKPFTPAFHSRHELTIDHNPPISKAPEGFVYTINNISLLCRSCNARKGNR